ncbi:MAG TPA: hypothetical protein VMV49_08580 [Candidatus Deferrimicrobium sp.]|nr:hypothetical protein [Candidatus Deferrimicrobium sp.]
MGRRGRIIGGILVIIGGFSVLFDACEANFWTGTDTFEYMTHISVVMTNLCSILILIGGVLLCVDKGGGGIIALIGVGILLVGWFIPLFSFLTLTLHSGDLFMNNELVAPILIISGSIMGLVMRDQA